MSDAQEYPHGCRTLDEYVAYLDRALPTKKTYVVIESVRGICTRPIQGKWDFILCPWSYALRVVEQYLESLEIEEMGALSFKVYSWTQEEHDAWCEEHGVEVS